MPATRARSPDEVGVERGHGVQGDQPSQTPVVSLGEYVLAERGTSPERVIDGSGIRACSLTHELAKGPKGRKQKAKKR